MLPQLILDCRATKSDCVEIKQPFHPPINEKIYNRLTQNTNTSLNKKSHVGKPLIDECLGIRNGALVAGCSNGVDIKCDRKCLSARILRSKTEPQTPLAVYVDDLSPRFSRMSADCDKIRPVPPQKTREIITTSLNIENSDYTPNPYPKPKIRLPNRAKVRTLLPEAITDAEGLKESFEKVMDIENNPLWKEIQDKYKEILEEEDKHGIGEDNEDIIKMVIEIYDEIINLFPQSLTSILSETLENIMQSITVSSNEGVEELSLKYSIYLENELERLNDEWSLWMSREYRLNNELNDTNRHLESLQNQKDEIELSISNIKERIFQLKESNEELVKIRSQRLNELEVAEITHKTVNKEATALELHNACTYQHQVALNSEYVIAEDDLKDMKRKLDTEIVPEVSYNELLDNMDEMKNKLTKMNLKYTEGISLIDEYKRNLVIMQEEYNKLIKERKELFERKGYCTPRPEWEDVTPILNYNEECENYCKTKNYEENSTLVLSYTLCNNIHEVRITGGMAAELTRKKHDLEEKRIKNERMKNVILLERLQDINVNKDDPNIQFFHGLGNSEDIPKYLRYKGTVEFRKYTIEETFELIKDLIEYTENNNNNNNIKRDEFIYNWLLKRVENSEAIPSSENHNNNKNNIIKKEVIEISYNLLYWLQYYSSRDPKIKIILKSIMNELPLLIYNEMYKINEKLLLYLQKIEMLDLHTDIGILPKYHILHSFHDLFPLKDTLNESKLCTSLHLDITKLKTSTIPYKHFFENKFDKTQSYLLREIYNEFIDEIFDHYNHYMIEVGKIVLDGNNNTTITGLKGLLKKIDENISDDTVSRLLEEFMQKNDVKERINPYDFYNYLTTVIYIPTMIYNINLI